MAFINTFTMVTRKNTIFYKVMISILKKVGAIAPFMYPARRKKWKKVGSPGVEPRFPSKNVTLPCYNAYQL